MGSWACWIACALCATAAMLTAGCMGFGLAEKEADAMRAEIEAMAADLSSTQDSDCGVVGLYLDGICDNEALVYSRATVDEDRLLAKVQQYNEFQQLVARLFGIYCIGDPVAYYPDTLPPVLVSEDGVCVLREQEGAGT